MGLLKINKPLALRGRYDLNDFVAAMKSCLSPGGVITVEFPHLLNLMEHTQFNTIYHEHFSYFSFFSVRKVFEYHELEIFDVDLLPTHGGSLRIYGQHRQGLHVPTNRIKLLEQEEKVKGLDQMDSYLTFEEKAKRLKHAIRTFFQQVASEKKRVVAYGAPAKGNTLLNFCGLGKSDILFTVDKNPYKQGRFLPGTHLPICSPQKIAEVKPDYLFILPWNLKQEIMEQMHYIRAWGGKFVIPTPKLEVM